MMGCGLLWTNLHASASSFCSTHHASACTETPISVLGAHEKQRTALTGGQSLLSLLLPDSAAQLPNRSQQSGKRRAPGTHTHVEVAVNVQQLLMVRA